MIAELVVREAGLHPAWSIKSDDSGGDDDADDDEDDVTGE